MTHPDETRLSPGEHAIALLNSGDDLLSSQDGEICFPRANHDAISAAFRLLDYQFAALAAKNVVAWKHIAPLGGAIEALREAAIINGPEASFNVTASMSGEIDPEQKTIVLCQVELAYGVRLAEYLLQKGVQE